MIIAVDFDGVLHNPDDVATNVLTGKKMGAPIEGAKEALKELRRDKNEIVIYSNRLQTYHDFIHVIDYLKYFNLEYDSISLTKPNADVYLDDKAIKFKSWNQALHEIQDLKTN